MDAISQEFFDLKFKDRIREGAGEEFQDFFSTIMELAFPNDFQRIRPWGRDGDQKNDGFLRSRELLFAVYSPDTETDAKTKAKVTSDFNGALPYWRSHFRVWAFVHNARKGLSPELFRHLKAIEDDYNELDVEYWDPPMIRTTMLSLNRRDIESILGALPDRNAFANLRNDHIDAVIRQISRDQVTSDTPIQQVPPNKIAHNRLSSEVEKLLELGYSKSHMVARFFESYTPNPTLGDEVADTLRTTYDYWKGVGLEPDEIFAELQQAVNWTNQAQVPQQVAALAILAHFFESCDIFERPPEEAASAAPH